VSGFFYIDNGGLNLHGEDGFDLLQALSAASFHTIVVSAYAGRVLPHLKTA